MSKLGDLTFEILLKVTDAESGAKRVTASLKDVDNAAKQVTQSTSTLSGKLSNMGFVLNGVREAGQILSSSLRTIFSTIKSSNDAYQEYLSSNRQLSAAAILTGANLTNLNKISEQTKNKFSLTSGQANLFTIELTKLGQKAGDVSKVQESINALMNLGAGQGLTAEQSLYAIKQAILGIDEGTDKLFQKNPSVIYDDYAKSIGTTAGKLTDQQKAQALLNAVLVSGNKLTGSYSDYLNSAAGKQQELNNKILDAKIKFGEQLQPVLLNVLNVVNDLLNSFAGLSSGMQTFVIIAGTAVITLGKLLPLVGSLVTTFPKLGTAGAGAGKTIAGWFGKGGLVVAAIATTLYAVKELVDYLNSISNEIKINTPKTDTRTSDVLEGSDGSLDNYFKRKNSQLKPGQFFTDEEINKTKKESEELKKKEQQVQQSLNKTLNLNKQGSNSNRELKESYKELTEEVRTFGDLIKELNVERTIEELKDKLSRQKEIDESRGRVRGFYGPDDKDKGAAEAKAKKEASKVPEAFEKSLSLSQQLTDILGLGADNFAVKFVGAVSEGLSLAQSFASLLNLILGSGSGGIFSLLGFASGGSVPGSGSGDTVPAMLTPGEFVVKKSIVDKIGSGFFDWINGGGMMARLTGRYATGGLVTGASGGVQVVVLDTKISGNDISLSQRRTNKTDSRRKF